MLGSLVLALCCCFWVVACGGDSFKGAVFSSASGRIQITGSIVLESPLQQAQDYPEARLSQAYVAPVEGTKSGRLTEFRLETADRTILVAALLSFDRKGQYVLDDSMGSLHVFVGETCKGASGDMSVCDWYSPMFFGRGCSIDVRDSSDVRLTGQITCGQITCKDLGANCSSGSGQRSADGICVEGRRPGLLSISVSFVLSEPDRTVTVPRVTAD
jgi:hypothetical protein